MRRFAVCAFIPFFFFALLTYLQDQHRLPLTGAVDECLDVSLTHFPSHGSFSLRLTTCVNQWIEISMELSAWRSFIILPYDLVGAPVKAESFLLRLRLSYADTWSQILYLAKRLGKIPLTYLKKYSTLCSPSFRRNSPWEVISAPLRMEHTLLIQG